MSTNEQEDVNQAHVLVEEAFELMEEKLEQDEITTEDMEDVYDALEEAYTHPDADIWVTITALGPKNRVSYHIHPPDAEHLPMGTPRETLEQIVNHEIEVTVN